MEDEPPDPTDADIEASLRRAAPEDWAALWALVDSLTDADRRAVWSRDAHATYTDTVERILGQWSALGVVQAVDWIRWGGLSKYRGGAGLDEAPVAEAVRLATAIVRADRFNEGMLESALQDGSFDAVLRRVRRCIARWLRRRATAGPDPTAECGQAHRQRQDDEARQPRNRAAGSGGADGGGDRPA